MRESTDDRRQSDLTCITDQKAVVKEMIEAIVHNKEISKELHQLHKQVQEHATKFEEHAGLLEGLKKSFDDFKHIFGTTTTELAATNSQQNIKLSEIQCSQDTIKTQLSILSPFIDKARWAKAAKWPIIYAVVVTIVLLIKLDGEGKIEFIKTIIGIL